MKNIIRFEWLKDVELEELAIDVLKWETKQEFQLSKRMMKVYDKTGLYGPGTKTFVHGEVFREIFRREI